MLDATGWDLPNVTKDWTGARPFSHVVIDDAVPRASWHRVLAAFDDEPAHPMQDEIFDVLASAAQVEHPTLIEFQRSLEAPETMSALSHLAGESLTSVQMRAYAYQAGHYLLPHADHSGDGRRKIAFAYYVDALSELLGGELELFDCEVVDDEIVRTSAAERIPVRANRLVLFEVGPSSLHQVREVVRGTRLSLAGWFIK